MIVSNFQAAIFQIGHAVKFIFEVEPSGQGFLAELNLSLRDSEKNNFLARDEDARAQKLGEKFGEPGAAGIDEGSGGNIFAVSGHEGCDAAFAERRKCGSGAILHSDFVGLLNYGLHGAAGHEDAAFWFEDAPGVVVKRDLGVVFAQAHEREALVRDIVILQSR